jgi:hypothetical protein
MKTLKTKVNVETHVLPYDYHDLNSEMSIQNVEW